MPVGFDAARNLKNTLKTLTCNKKYRLDCRGHRRQCHHQLSATHYAPFDVSAFRKTYSTGENRGWIVHCIRPLTSKGKDGTRQHSEAKRDTERTKARDGKRNIVC